MYHLRLVPSQLDQGNASVPLYLFACSLAWQHGTVSLNGATGLPMTTGEWEPNVLQKSNWSEYPSNPEVDQVCCPVPLLNVQNHLREESGQQCCHSCLSLRFRTVRRNMFVVTRPLRQCQMDCMSLF